MITLRPAGDRGRAQFGWVDSYHTFSFGDYHDPEQMGFRDLRVINEDWVQPGQGFPTHPHREMEIITYVLEGALEHKDSLGTGSVIRPGEVQVMSAGTGIRHSEFNASKTDPVHLLQIWILPGTQGIQPRYDQRSFPEIERRGKLRLVVSRDGRDGALSIHSDARVYAASLDAVGGVTHRLAPGRGAWLQVARGAVSLNGTKLGAGDGAAVTQEGALTVRASEDSEVLLFDLP